MPFLGVKRDIYIFSVININYTELYVAVYFAPEIMKLPNKNWLYSSTALHISECFLEFIHLGTEISFISQTGGCSHTGYSLISFSIGSFPSRYQLIILGMY